MIQLVPHIIWATVAVFMIHELRTMLREWRDYVSPKTEGPIEVPDDLVALANEERESWAQEETIRAMRERYEALGDWNLVRSAFGIGKRD